MLACLAVNIQQIAPLIVKPCFGIFQKQFNDKPAMYGLELGWVFVRKNVIIGGVYMPVLRSATRG